MTSLLQYKMEHYGKYYDFEPTLLYHNEVSLAAIGPGTGALMCEPLDEIPGYHLGVINGRIGIRMRGQFGQNEPIKKIVLLVLEKKVIASKILPDRKTIYLKIHTTNPYTEKMQQYWIREEWAEPLEKHNTYEEDAAANLRKHLEEKGLL